MPLVAPVTKHASTIFATDDVPPRRRRGRHRRAHAAPRPGLPRPAARSHLRLRRGGDPEAPAVPVIEPDDEDVAKAAALIASAQRPVIIAGSDVYGGDAVAALREAAEALAVPVFANGMGRGEPAAGAPARVREGPPGRARRRRRRRRHRHAARLPARASATSATPRSSTSSTRRRSARRT